MKKIKLVSGSTQNIFLKNYGIKEKWIVNMINHHNISCGAENMFFNGKFVSPLDRFEQYETNST